MTYNDAIRILRLPYDFNEQQLKHQYRFLAKQHHPDTSQNEHAHENMCLVNMAYEFLVGIGRTASTVPGLTSYDRVKLQELSELVAAQRFQQEQERLANGIARHPHLLAGCPCWLLCPWS